MTRRSIKTALVLLCFLQGARCFAASNRPAIPQIPTDKTISTTDAVKLRDELEIIQADVQNKIVRLEAAKKAYDRSRSDVEENLKKVQEERRRLDETLQKEKKLKDDRVKASVDFVAKMDPRKIAPIVENMDQELVAELFSRLPARQVTNVLENISPANAARFLEFYTRIRSGKSNDSTDSASKSQVLSR